MPDGPDRLFEVPDDDPPVESAAASERRRPILERDDEGLWSRRIQLHSADKAYYVRYYAEMVGTGMRRVWPNKLWWVELFAGPGRLLNEGTGMYESGSPVEAVRIPDPFTGYVFADLDARCVDSLRARVGHLPNVWVEHGDANSANLHDRIGRIVPRNALVVLYLDPEGLDSYMPTIGYFADRYRHLDLLLNFSVTGVIRALSAGHPEKAGRVLGHPNPRELLAGPGQGERIRDVYQRKLRQMGYDHFETKVIKLQEKNREIYDLMIASRDPKAIEFFRKATNREPGGQYRIDL